jgi:hypothetical protein
MKSTPVKSINQLASLMVGQLQVKEARSHCLLILINLTYCSVNTSIYLADVLQAIPTVLKYIDEYPSDVAWLLSHLMQDASPSKFKFLLQDRFLQKISPYIAVDMHNFSTAARTFLQNISETNST